MRNSGLKSWVLTIGLFALLLAQVSCRKYESIKDTDCGWHGMRQSECEEKGCVWFENFSGPWCQYSDSPYLPGYFNLRDLNEDETTILQYAITGFIVLTVSMIIGEFKSKSSVDFLILVALFLIAWTTRYYRIDHPHDVVFDEYYFGQFANNYCNKIYVFDIHPPLPKLTHHFVGSLLGHECTFDFQNPNQTHYQSEAQYVHLREISAFFGTLTIPVGYLLARTLDFSCASSTLFSTLLLCDSLLLSETRLVLTDSQLFFYVILAVFSAFQLWKSPAGSWRRAFWTIFAGIVSGCVFSTKFTTLAVLGWIVLLSMVSYFPYKHPISLQRIVVCMILGILVFMIPFYVHFKLGVNSGTMDWNLDAVHQSWLKGSPVYNPHSKPHSFLRQFVYIIRRMLEQNAASTGSHPYASVWLEWIVAKGALLSHSFHMEDKDHHEHIFIVSNPLICYSILGALVLFAFVSFFLIRSRTWRKITEDEKWFNLLGWSFFFGWVANLLPYALVVRTTYSYHYLPGQLFGMLLITLLFEFLPKKILSWISASERTVKVVRLLFCAIAMAMLFYSYFYMSGLVYGYPTTQLTFSQRQWMVSK